MGGDARRGEHGSEERSVTAYEYGPQLRPAEAQRSTPTPREPYRNRLGGQEVGGQGADGLDHMAGYGNALVSQRRRGHGRDRSATRAGLDLVTHLVRTAVGGEISVRISQQKWLLTWCFVEQPQRDSNPCRHLERAVYIVHCVRNSRSAYP